MTTRRPIVVFNPKVVVVVVLLVVVVLVCGRVTVLVTAAAQAQDDNDSTEEEASAVHPLVLRQPQRQQQRTLRGTNHKQTFPLILRNAKKTSQNRNTLLWDDPKTVSRKERFALKKQQQQQQQQNEASISVDSISNQLSSSSCAIVFSSGTLLKYNDGPYIDTFDSVIRINGASPDGYESHVGHKTTHWLVNFPKPHHDKNFFVPGIWFASLNDTSVTGLTIEHPIFPTEAEGYAQWHTHTASDWVLLPLSIVQECHALVGLRPSQWCSSGMNIALWAMDTCRNVTIFGMEEDACYPYHFDMPWSPQQQRDCSLRKNATRTRTTTRNERDVVLLQQKKHSPINQVFDRNSPGHSMLREHEVLEELHQQGRLTIHRLWDK